MVRECPKCGTVNPPTAEQCDCGYEFATGRVSGSPIRRPPGSAAAWLLVPVGLMVGAPLGGLVLMTWYSAPGLGGLGPMIWGAFWGAVLGSAAGVVAAMLIRRRQRTR